MKLGKGCVAAALLLSAVMLLWTGLPVTAAYENTHNNTGKPSQDILAAAESSWAIPLRQTAQSITIGTGSQRELYLFLVSDVFVLVCGAGGDRHGCDPERDVCFCRLGLFPGRQALSEEPVTRRQ
ncbi:MAG: hypothetical protein ACLT3Y_05450 [Ruminococcus callidus]